MKEKQPSGTNKEQETIVTEVLLNATSAGQCSRSLLSRDWGVRQQAADRGIQAGAAPARWARYFVRSNSKNSLDERLMIWVIDIPGSSDHEDLFVGLQMGKI